MSKLVANKKGAVLLLTLMVLLVLSILCATLLEVGLAGAKHAKHSADKTQAYYFARAGVDDVADYIIENKTAPAIAANTQKVLGTSSQFYMIDSITSPGIGRYLVAATGSDNGTTNQVSLNVIKDKASDIFDVAVYSAQNLDVSKMEVIGDVRSAGTITFDTNKLLGTPHPKSPMEAKYKELPIVLPTLNYLMNGAVQINDFTNQLTTINVSCKLDSMNIGNLIIDTTGYTSQNPLRILVNTLDINGGTFEIIGDGKLELYVHNVYVKANIGISGSNTRVDILLFNMSTSDLGFAEFQTPISINNDPNKLNIFLDKASTLQLQANATTYAYIFGPEATIVMQSSQTSVNGAIIGNVLEGNGNRAMGSITYSTPDNSNDYSFSIYRKRLYQ